MPTDASPPASDSAGATTAPALRALVNGRVLTDHGLIAGLAVMVQGERIVGIVADGDARLDGAERHDLGGRMLLPGFIDSQCNGGGGVLFNNAPTVASLRTIAAAHRRFGTTGFLPTLITDTPEVMHAAVQAVAQAIAEGVPGVIGIHLEGPFLNMARKGIHDAAKFRLPDAADMALLTRGDTGVVLMTLAPERVAPEFIDQLVHAGVVVAAGHTAADYDTTRAALRAGVSGFTHLFNAMTPLTSREPGAVGAALDDAHSWCGVIVDGQHVHPASLRVAIAAKPTGKIMLVTDAMPPVGSDTDSFELDGQTIRREDGVCKNDAGTLAGSALDMASAVRNAVEMLGLPLGEASRMASAYPAAFLGLAGKQGRIAVGQRADFAVLDDGLHVHQTWIGGVAYRSDDTDAADAGGTAPPAGGLAVVPAPAKPAQPAAAPGPAPAPLRRRMAIAARRGAASLRAGWRGVWAATLALLLLCLWGAGAEAAVRIDLPSDWRFRTDPKDEGVAAGWPRALPAGTRAVDIPHTWNVGADADFEGTGWYFRRLDLPNVVANGLAADAHVELHFGATFYTSRIWLNGVEVGRHEGGHTAYWFDISKLLRKDGPNVLAVAIDNRPSIHSIPGYAMRQAASKNVWYDWWHYGGIVRDVWLSVGDGPLIRRQVIDTDLGGKPGQGPARVSTRIDIENPTAAAQRFVLKTTAYAPDGRVAAVADGQAQLPAGGKEAATLRLAIDQPVLWNIGDGQLYRLVSELRDASGRLLDTRTDTLGLRKIEVRQRKLWVNGQPVRLTGLTRHEDSPWEGLAETRGTVRRDWDDLRALHTTLTRPVHYPQHPAVLDDADRHGILLVPEIPMWQFTEAQMKDPRVLSLAQSMMAEMIAADGNHPSIFAWSVCNESDTKLPGGLAYVRAMKSLINTIDPRHFVTFADADLSIPPWPDSRAAHEIDFIMANAYFGSWSGSGAQVEPWLDFMDKTYPEKMVIVSEYGYPGPFSRNPIEADQVRSANLREQLDAFAKRDFVAGAIFWTYQDYKSHRNLWAGETAGYVEHGVVDEHRQRKPSYAVYQQRNAPLSGRLSWSSGDDGLTGFKAQLQGNGPKQMPSYPLVGYRAEWRMQDRDGRRIGEGTQLLPSLDTPFTLQGSWPAEKGLKEATLWLRVFAPDGALALELRQDHSALRFGAALYPGDADAAAAMPAQ